MRFRLTTIFLMITFAALVLVFVRPTSVQIQLPPLSGLDSSDVGTEVLVFFDHRNEAGEQLTSAHTLLSLDEGTTATTATIQVQRWEVSRFRNYSIELIARYSGGILGGEEFISRISIPPEYQ